MKIGILTFHNIPNFGAVLQAYSLCKALRQMGYECDIINYQCDNIISRELTYHPHPNFIKNLIIRKLIWPITEEKIRGCNDFMLRTGLCSKESYDRNTIFEANTNYDVFMSGSDMIWDFTVTNKDTTFLLDFVKDNKLKYSYGSSCGDDIWSEQDLENVKKLLLRYKGIAVREEVMQKKLRSLGVDSILVADPTMLIDSVRWGQIAVTPKNENYVLVYFPSDKNLTAASKYAKKIGAKVVVLNWGLPMRKYKIVSPYNPQEWVGYLKNASAVFTNSYHGLLFALYFNKPVWIGKEGNRFNSILNYLNINKVYLDQDKELTYRIDYDKVNVLLSNLRNESLNYLRGIKDVK